MPAKSLPNLVIIGVGRSGTTSLFHYLGCHPEICASSEKEIGFFTPLLYGGDHPPLDEYRRYFSHCAGAKKYYLEASPGYFGGGRVVASKIQETLGADTQIILILREPVSRFLSYYHYAKSRLHIPRAMGIEEFFRVSLEIAQKPRWNWEERHFWGFKECHYANYLPEWLDAFTTGFQIVFFDDLIKDPQAATVGLCGELGLSPAVYLAEGDRIFTRENRSMEYQNAALQRVALGVNDLAKRVWRRSPRLKANLRELYYFFNGRSISGVQPSGFIEELRGYFLPHNQKLAALLLERRPGLALPAWLEF